MRIYRAIMPGSTDYRDFWSEDEARDSAARAAYQAVDVQEIDVDATEALNLLRSAILWIEGDSDPEAKAWVRAAKKLLE